VTTAQGRGISLGDYLLFLAALTDCSPKLKGKVCFKALFSFPPMQGFLLWCVGTLNLYRTMARRMEQAWPTSLQVSAGTGDFG